MKETRRRAYLKAMEIPLWLPREQAVLNAEDTPASVGEPVVESAMPVDRVMSVPSVVSEIQPPVLTDVTADHPDWDVLAARVAACRACAELAATRSKTVFGVGDRRAHLMVIGEAPGADEDQQGEPFVGRAGQLLTQMLRAIGFAREQVFIANILKCRPPGNRDPHASEAQNCLPFLARQLELVRPRLLLAVGRIAAQQLLQTNVPVGQLRNKLHVYGDQRIPLLVTYHPAYLLRSPSQKAAAWQDLQQVLRFLRTLPE